MSNFTVPHTFIGGTKAKAEDVNENFSAIKDELNLKLEKNNDGSVVVAEATESSHAVNKGQVESMLDELSENFPDTSFSNLSEAALKKFQYIPYSINSGNVDENGRPDIIYADIENSSSSVSFMVGEVSENQYPKLTGVLANGSAFERESISDIDFLGLADGEYNIFVGKSGDAIAFKNTIYRQKKQPQITIESEWIQPTLSENGLIGGSEFAVDSSSSSSSTPDAYMAFNGLNDNKYASSANGATFYWISWYNPTPLKISSISIYNANYSGATGPTGGIVQGSDDNSTWEDIVTFTNSVTAINQTWSISVNSNKSYKYHRIYVPSANFSNSRARFGAIYITATEFVQGLQINDVWLNTSVRPFVSKKYNGIAFEDFDYVPLPQTVILENGVVSSINLKTGYGDNLSWNTTDELSFINPAVIVEKYTNGKSGYRVWSDGYCEQWGFVAVSSTAGVVTIQFMKKFADTNYMFFRNSACNNNNATNQTNYVGSWLDETYRTSETIAVMMQNGNMTGSYWIAMGYLN
ncbi:hypothetical protein IJ818_04150 [bacterium]|nr:hypothetical protein [bacterium]